MSMAFYQGELALDPENLGFPAQNISKVRRLVLKSVETKLYELAFTSETPVYTHLCQTSQGKLLSVVCTGEKEGTRIESSLSVY